MNALSKDTIFAEKSLLFAKKIPDINKNKGVLLLKRIFSETPYVCVLSYQISSFQDNFNKFKQNQSLKNQP